MQSSASPFFLCLSFVLRVDLGDWEVLGPSSNRSFVKTPAQDGQERIWLVVDFPQLPHVIDDCGKIKRVSSSFLSFVLVLGQLFRDLVFHTINSLRFHP